MLCKLKKKIQQLKSKSSRFIEVCFDFLAVCKSNVCCIELILS